MMYHIHEAHLRIFFWHLLMNFEKLKEPEFPKDDQKKKQQQQHTKRQKKLEISSFYTCVPKTTIRYSP